MRRTSQSLSSKFLDNRRPDLLMLRVKVRDRAELGREEPLGLCADFSGDGAKTSLPYTRSEE